MGQSVYMFVHTLKPNNNEIGKSMSNMPTLFVFTVHSTAKDKLQQSSKFRYVQVFNWKLRKYLLK